jgi:hypothetical protein
VKTTFTLLGAMTVQEIPRGRGSVIVTSLARRFTDGAMRPFSRTADAGIWVGNRSAAGKETSRDPGPGFPHRI